MQLPVLVLYQSVLHGKESILMFLWHSFSQMRDISQKKLQIIKKISFILGMK